MTNHTTHGSRGYGVVAKRIPVPRTRTENRSNRAVQPRPRRQVGSRPPLRLSPELPPALPTIHAPETTHVTAENPRSERQTPPTTGRHPPGAAVYILAPPPPFARLVVSTTSHPHHRHLVTAASTHHTAAPHRTGRRALRPPPVHGHGRRALRRGEGREERGGEAALLAAGGAPVPAAAGWGEGVGAVVRAARRGRQHRAVRRGDVRQQLPRPRLSPRRRRRRRLRRPRVPPPLLLPAAQREPAPRPLVGHAAEAGGTCMGQSCAGAPGMEARHLHLAARRCCPPSSQHGQPRAHRTQARATVWIRENWHHLPCFWRRRQRAVIALRQEHHLRRRFWSSVRTPWRHAVGALHQLDHLLKQGRSPGNAADRHRHQPRHRHPPARRQLRAHRRVPHRLPPGVRLPDAPALRVDAALRPALRRQVHQQEVPGLSVGSAGRGFGPRCRRVRRWAGDAFQRSERE